jgi:hypothetical protein
MKVYVLEVGCYDQTYVAGIFASPELAMAANNKGTWTRTLWSEGLWQSWSNDLDWSDRAEIVEEELVAAGPLRSVDKIRVQEKEAQPWAEKWQSWVYRPVTPTEADLIMAGKQTSHKEGCC